MLYTLDRYFRIRKYNRYVDRYQGKKKQEEQYRESWFEAILGFIWIISLLGLFMFVGCLYR